MADNWCCSLGFGGGDGGTRQGFGNNVGGGFGESTSVEPRYTTE